MGKPCLGASGTRKAMCTALYIGWEDWKVTLKVPLGGADNRMKSSFHRQADVTPDLEVVQTKLG